MTEYQEALDRLDQEEFYRRGDELIILQELADRAELIMPVEKSIEDCGIMGFDFLCECGESVRQTNRFCPKCGHPLGFKG